jgi:hypothetical protein
MAHHDAHACIVACNTHTHTHTHTHTFPFLWALLMIRNKIATSNNGNLLEGKRDACTTELDSRSEQGRSGQGRVVQSQAEPVIADQDRAVEFMLCVVCERESSLHGNETPRTVAHGCIFPDKQRQAHSPDHRDHIVQAMKSNY